MVYDKRKAMEMADEMAKEFDADTVGREMKRFEGEGFFDDLKTLYDIITDKRFEIDNKTWMAIAGALVYAVSPVDLVPDFIFLQREHNDLLPSPPQV